ITVTGYGLMVVAPLIQQMIAPSVGRLVGLFIMLGVYIYAIRVVWSRHRSVRATLMLHANAMQTTVFGTLVRVFARIWHVLAIAYFTVLLVVTQVDQSDALSFMANATVQTLAAVAVGAFILAILSSMLARRIRLSDDLKQRLPLLEDRINSYVPAVIQALRIAVVIAAALVVLDAWRAFNLAEWVYS